MINDEEEFVRIREILKGIVEFLQLLTKVFASVFFTIIFYNILHSKD